jgi:hypothetical protein
MLRQKDMSLQAQRAPQQAAYSDLADGRRALGHETLGPHHFASDSMSQPFLLPNTPSDAGTPQPFGVIDYRQSPGYPSDPHPNTRPLPGHSSYSPVPDHDHIRHPAPTAPSSTSVSSFGAPRSLPDSRNNSHPSPPTAATNSPDRDLFRDLFWPSWPARLPTPELLQHLCAVSL